MRAEQAALFCARYNGQREPAWGASCMGEQAESAAAVSVAGELPDCEPDNEADSGLASDFADDGFFQWTKQWYPMATVACLDPQKPLIVAFRQ